jgi:hypothetical protein
VPPHRVIAFKKFPEAKTGKNIAEWLRQSHSKAGLKGEYIMCHSTDGASNAVASSMEFQAMTDAVKASSICHCTCFAHQVNRSAKYASGTGDFKTPANTELAKVMKKLHKINGHVYRNKTRSKVLFAVQTKKIGELLLQASLFCLDRFLVFLTSTTSVVFYTQESHSTTVPWCHNKVELRS